MLQAAFKRLHQSFTETADDIHLAFVRMRQAIPSPATATESADGECHELAPEDYTDPHRMARRFLAGHAHPDRCRLAFCREHFWIWTGTRWDKRPDAEIRGQLAAFCNRDFAANFMPTDERPTIPKVTTGLVSNILQALSGEVMLPQETPLPAWLGDGPANRSYLALANGLLDVVAFLSGKAEYLGRIRRCGCRQFACHSTLTPLPIVRSDRRPDGV